MSRGIIVIENVLAGIVLKDIINDAEVYSLNKFKGSDNDNSKSTDWIEEYFNIQLVDVLDSMISKRMLNDYKFTISVLIQEKLYGLLVEYYKLRKLFAFKE
tara:strand:- start:221 stop:523 length:303 start_codon:yes stop_codon:yes gene_type:complete